MRKHLLLAWAVVCLVAAQGSEDAVTSDVAKWQGTWQAVSMENDGKAMPDESLKKIRLTVTGTDYHFQNGSFNEHGCYRFDVAKDPKQLDIIVGDGKDKGKVHLVIYKFEGGRLTLCLDAANKQRPTEFTGRAGSGCVLEVWQRIKASTD